MRSKQVLVASALASFALHFALILFSRHWISPWSVEAEHVNSVRLIQATLTQIVTPLEQAANLTAAMAETPLVDSPIEKPHSQTIGAAANAPLMKGGFLYGPLDFVPSEYLSFSPKPLAEIEIPFPESLTGDVSLRLELALYIDEDGVVQKVQIAASHVPPQVQTAAVTSFLASRFKPGEIDGQVVRSLLRVEVHFESHLGDLSRTLRTSTIAM